jgi:hypothetical protein
MQDTYRYYKHLGLQYFCRKHSDKKQNRYIILHIISTDM